jgi:pimeloyl-ACP methyl ester carboxylesterase
MRRRWKKDDSRSMSVRIQTLFLETDPRIAVALSGARQEEAVIFLHGLGSTKESWHRQLEYFGETHFAVAWDARGYGESGDYPGELVFDRDFVADLNSTMNSLGIGRAHLIGLSMGGVIAQSFYFVHPSRVASLVLAHTFPDFRSLGEDVVADFIARRLQPILDGGSPADLALSAARVLLSANAPDEAKNRLIASLSALRKESYVKAVRALVTHASARALEVIAVPTLILAGELDRLVPVSMAQHMAARISGSELAIVKGAGHLSNLERPEEFNQIVQSFLQRRTAPDVSRH